MTGQDGQDRRGSGISAGREPVVAIDGPAGAGKGAISALLAARFGYELLETGAIYRALALTARRRDIPIDDGEQLGAVGRGMTIRFERRGGVNHVALGGEDVTPLLREPAVGDAASRIAGLPPVRAALLDVQRRLGEQGGVVAEGRDIGTVVFPAAEVKFFLTATPEERARRRWLQLREAGEEHDYAEILAAQQRRDEADSTRAVAPLVQAPDAIVIDSTSIDIDGVVDAMSRHVLAVRERLGLPAIAPR